MNRSAPPWLQSDTAAIHDQSLSNLHVESLQKVPDVTDLLHELALSLSGCSGAALFSSHAAVLTQVSRSGEEVDPAMLDRIATASGGWPEAAFEFVIAADRNYVIVGGEGQVLVLLVESLDNVGMAVAFAKAQLDAALAQAVSSPPDSEAGLFLEEPAPAWPRVAVPGSSAHDRVAAADAALRKLEPVRAAREVEGPQRKAPVFTEHLQRLVKLFQVCARLGTRSGTITVRTRGEPGAILIERGRICWVVCGETRRYLSDRLAEQSSLSSEQFRGFVQKAQQEGLPLGEFLARHSLITPEALRAALFEHSMASLVSLVSREITEVQVVPRANNGFDSRFTFDLVDMVEKITNRFVELPALIQTRFPEAQIDGATVMGVGRAPLPIGRFGRGTLPLNELLDLALRGRRALESLGGEQQHVLATFNCVGSCWSANGKAGLFSVSEAYSRLGFSWMVTQAQLFHNEA